MNLLVKIEDNAADDSIQKLIDRRFKELLLNDKYIQGRIDELLDKAITKRVDILLGSRLENLDWVGRIALKVMSICGITSNALAK